MKLEIHFIIILYYSSQLGFNEVRIEHNLYNDHGRTKNISQKVLKENLVPVDNMPVFTPQSEKAFLKFTHERFLN